MRLSCALLDASSAAALSGSNGDVELDAFEAAIAAAEADAGRFRGAHEELSSAVAGLLQTAASDYDASPLHLLNNRDMAFEAFQKSTATLAACEARIDVPSLQQSAQLRLQPLTDALQGLAAAAGVNLDIVAAVGENDGKGPNVEDVRVVEHLALSLQRNAEGLASRVEGARGRTQDYVGHLAAHRGSEAMMCFAKLHQTVSDVMALDGSDILSECTVLGVLKRDSIWQSLLTLSNTLIAPLRDTSDTLDCLFSRAALLQTEVCAVAAGLADRGALTLRLKKAHKAMKHAKALYHELKAKHSLHAEELDDPDDSDDSDDSDNASPHDTVDPMVLARARSASARATRERDEAARSLFLAAKAYHPETLFSQRRRLRLTGLSSVWSERSRDDYDHQQRLSRPEARHMLLRARYEGVDCVLKQVPLHEGETLGREAEVLRRLDHPHIVKLEAAFVDADSLYLHFRYAKHGDLENYLWAQGQQLLGTRVTVVQLQRMARQLCGAVAYLAERNIVHCDIKPANVFVDEADAKTGDGCPAPVAILGDFDVSHTASGRTATLTMALQTRGVATHYSAGYAAPEVLCAPAGQPPRATSKLDVYGLGCVIYHMHMYPRALPEPESLGDEVAAQDKLFDASARDVLSCDNAVWYQGVLRNAIANATRANPIARLSASELLMTKYMQEADSDTAQVEVQRPAHWLHQQQAGTWLVTESADVVAQVEKLLNDSARPQEHGIGRDSHDKRFERFKVTSVKRVENSYVWSAYASRRRAVAESLALEGYTLPLQARQLTTTGFVYPLEGGSLEAAAGEVYLFHGTGFPESISTSGFDVRYAYAGRGAGAFFGRGVYFAESASKSDQYVSPSNSTGRLTMVLARVCLGRCQVVESTRGSMPFLPEVEGKSTASVPVYYDSILADFKKFRFREIVVGRDASAYPELLVEYERV